MPFKDYIKELLDTVTDIDHDISEFSSHHNLDSCGTDVVLPALVQALKLKQYVLEKVVHDCGSDSLETDSLSQLHNAKKAESRKNLAAVKKRLFSLDKMVEESSANPGKSLCFGDNKVNGDLNYSNDMFSDADYQKGSLQNPVSIGDNDSDSDITVDLDDDINNSAEERSTTPNIENVDSNELDNSSGSSSGKKKYKFTPLKRDAVDGSAIVPDFGARKIFTDKKTEDRDSDDTDDLENFDDFNLEDLSSSTPSVKSTIQKAVCQETSHSPEVA